MAETIQQMQAAHNTGADKEYRNRAVAYLRRAATLIEFGEAEPVEITRTCGEEYDTFGVQWLAQVKK